MCLLVLVALLACPADRDGNPWTLTGVPGAFGAGCRLGYQCPGPMQCFPREELGLEPTVTGQHGVCTFPCDRDADCPDCIVEGTTIPHCAGCNGLGACRIPIFDK